MRILSIVGTAAADASVLPVPVELLLIGWTLSRPHLGWWLAAAYLAASVSGAPIGYAVGRRGVATFLQKRIPPDRWTKVEGWVQRYGAFGITFGGLTALPYPAFVITAGVFQMSLWKVLLAVAIGRGAKGFLSVALLLRFGRPALLWLEELGIVTVIVFAAVAVFVWLWWRNARTARISLRSD